MMKMSMWLMPITIDVNVIHNPLKGEAMFTASCNNSSPTETPSYNSE